MKKFLIALLVFFLPLLLGVTFLFVIPVNKKYAYDFISKGGCQGRPPWIYQQLFTGTTNIDVAFVGTSHTMSGVDDRLIEQTLDSSIHKKLVCKNISFCGFGRDFDYVIIKDLLEHKKPKLVVLEVRENEGQLGHASFPYVAQSSDLFGAPKFANRSYVPDIYKAFFFRLQYLRELFTGEQHTRDMQISPLRFGFNGNDVTANPDQLDYEAAVAAQSEKRKNASVENVLDKYPMAYVERIGEMVKQHGSQLIFVYLPAYTSQATMEEIANKYKPFGTVIFPDRNVLADKANWMDKEHLNLRGAETVSSKIALDLSGVLK